MEADCKKPVADATEPVVASERFESRMNSESVELSTYSGVPFLKMKGFANPDGPMYEVKVAALLFLRCKNNQLIKNFQLAVNLEGAGALDDVVLRFTTVTNPSVWHTCFIQLKHKLRAPLSLTALTAPNGDFSLVKYLKSIIDIEKMMTTNDSNVSNFFSGSFQNSHFILYTNSPSNVNQLHRTEPKLGEFKSLLCAEPGNDNEIYANVFCLNDQYKKMIVKILIEDKMKKMNLETKCDYDVVESQNTSEIQKYTEFLDKMVLFSSQPNENDLDNVIKKELLLASFKRSTSFNVDQLYPFYLATLKQWWMTSNFILDDTELSDVLQEAWVKHNIKSQKSDKILMDVTFCETCWDTWDLKFPQNNAIEHIVMKGKSLRLCYSQVVRFLEKRKQLFRSVLLEDMLKNQDALLSLFSQENLDVLIFVVESSDLESFEKLFYFINTLDKVLQTVQDLASIIIVSAENSNFINILQSKYSNLYHKIEVNFCLSYLSNTLIESLLNKEVIFQGINQFPISIKTFFQGKVELTQKILNDEIVENILTSSKLEVGPVLTKVIDYYIPRSLKREDIVKDDAFQARNATELFAIHGTTVERLKPFVPPGEKVGHINDIENNLCHIVVVDSTDFEKKQHSFQNKNIHTLQFDSSNGVFRWVSSEKNIEHIRKFINHEQFTVYQPDTALDIDGRVILLIAEPGMGKTTLIDHLAQETKQKNPSLWVVRANFNDLTDLLDNTHCEDVVEFLASAVDIKKESNFDYALFRTSFEYTGNVVVLLDGLDEIAPTYTEKAMKLLTGLLKTKVKKVWITSRHPIKDTLEEQLSTLSFNLQPFSEQNQRHFFKSFWKHKSNIIVTNENRLDDFISDLLHLLSHTIKDNDRLLSGIPLQTMILADVFAEQASEISENQEKNILPSKLDLLYLFEKFIDKKFQIFIREKVNLMSKNAEYLLVTIRNKFEMDHMYAALVLLIPRKHLQNLHAHNQILEESQLFCQIINNAKDKTGIVFSAVNNQPKFIHRTFAEYFGAKWFSQHFILNRQFLKNYLFTPNFKVVCNMFDRLITKNMHLHSAVLNNDTLRVEELLASGTTDVNSVDLGGRTGLHLAAALGYEFKPIHFNYVVDDRFIGPRPKHMVEIFLENGANITDVDNVLEWTPLQYALGTSTWDAMEFILATNQHLYHYIPTFIKNSNITIEPLNKVGRNFLHWASESGHSHLVEAFVQDTKADENFINMKDQLGFSSLHLASYRGHSDVVRVLIANGADIQDAFKEGKNCLHIACEKGHLNVVQTIIDSFGNEVNSVDLRNYIDIQDLRGNSALLHATYWGYTCIVRLLLLYGTNINARDRWGRTCLHKSAQRNHPKIAKIILDHLSKIQANREEYVNLIDWKGNCALHLAAYTGSCHVLENIIIHGGEAHVRNKRGRNCLHLAAERNQCGVLFTMFNILPPEERLEFINISDPRGLTAVHIASTFGFADFVKRLVDCGADVRKTDEIGRTALHNAAMTGQISIAVALIGKFTNDQESLKHFLEICDNSGLTAYDIAKSPDHLGLFTDSRAEFSKWIQDILMA